MLAVFDVKSRRIFYVFNFELLIFYILYHFVNDILYISYWINVFLDHLAFTKQVRATFANANPHPQPESQPTARLNSQQRPIYLPPLLLRCPQGNI